MKRGQYPSQEMIQSLFDYREGYLYERMNRRSTKGIGSKSGRVSNHGRLRVSIKGKDYLHAICVWIWHNGELPEELELDHINQSNCDDRIENLRLVDRSTNMKNREGTNVPNKGELSSNPCNVKRRKYFSGEQ